MRTVLARDRAVRLVVVWFVLSRLALLVALAVVSEARGGSLPEALTVFDGGWYEGISEDGYPARLPRGPDGVGQSAVAFFPLFPGLTAAPVALGTPFWLAATALNLVCGAAAAVLVLVLVRRWASERVALAAAVLWSVQPLAFVLSLAYSEALYSALALGCLLLLLQRRWVTAGIVAALASATRPSGLVLAVCAAAAALPAWRAGAPDRVRALAAPLLAPVGFVAYLGWLALHTGRLDAWFVTEREGWGVYTDGGVETARRFAHYLLSPTERPAATLVSLVLAVSLVALALAVKDGAPLPLLVFAVGTTVLALSTRNAFSSAPRFLLPASFVLLVPLVRRLWPGLERDASGPTALPWSLGGVAATALLALTAAAAYATTVSRFPP